MKTDSQTSSSDIVPFVLRHSGPLMPHVDSASLDMLICTMTTQNNGFVRHLPEEIIIEILSRLPADCVLKCRRVCKGWLALTLKPYFAAMHLERAAPVIFVQSLLFGSLRRDEMDLFIFDEGAKEDKMMKKMRAGSMNIGVEFMPTLSGSCNGLLLFSPKFPTNFVLCFICNPVTREQMTVRPPVRGGVLCGFFYHPLVKAFKLLLMHQVAIGFQYFLYSLGDKKWRKLVALSYLPTYSVNPVIVNGSLHWMMMKHDYQSAEISHCKNVIMMFNMDTEGFCTMPHPGKQCYLPKTLEMMQLIEKDGQLCFSYRCDRSLVIWVLDDYENWFWVKKYEVDLFVLTQFIPDIYTAKITLLNIQNDELLLDWLCRGLFRYHLGRNTVRKVGGAQAKLLDLCITTSCIKSFVSLNSGLSPLLPSSTLDIPASSSPRVPWRLTPEQLIHLESLEKMMTKLLIEELNLEKQAEDALTSMGTNARMLVGVSICSTVILPMSYAGGAVLSSLSTISLLAFPIAISIAYKKINRLLTPAAELEKRLGYFHRNVGEFKNETKALRLEEQTAFESSDSTRIQALERKQFKKIDFWAYHKRMLVWIIIMAVVQWVTSSIVSAVFYAKGKPQATKVPNLPRSAPPEGFWTRILDA